MRSECCARGERAWRWVGRDARVRAGWRPVHATAGGHSRSLWAGSEFFSDSKEIRPVLLEDGTDTGMVEVDGAVRTRAYRCCFTRARASVCVRVDGPSALAAAVDDQGWRHC